MVKSIVSPKLLQGPNELHGLIDEYKGKYGVGRPYLGSVGHSHEVAKRIADAYEAMPHQPDHPDVQRAYGAANKEIMQQYSFLKDKGFKFTPWRSAGQPYQNSKEMQDDVLSNKHIYYFPSESGFGQEEAQHDGNPLMHDSGERSADGKPMPYNDVLRAVHDVFGHAAHGHQFGPVGEERAWHAHASMFGEDAIPALTTETRGQNSWVNFGKHLRKPDGSIPGKGEEGYIHPVDRPFAEQKTGLLPSWTWHPSSVTQSAGTIRKAIDPNDNRTPSMFPEEFPRPGQYKDLTQSPGFKKWFADSHVREPLQSTKEDWESKKPLVVYHGTHKDFKDFNPVGDGTVSHTFGSYTTPRHGIFFSESPDHASSFATGPGGRVIPAHLSIQNPAYLDHLKDHELEALDQSGFNSRLLRTPGRMHWENFDGEVGKHFTDTLKKLGYDGAHFEDAHYDDEGELVGMHPTWVALYPHQVKSATGNRGDFDPGVPDMTKAVSRTPEHRIRQQLTSLLPSLKGISVYWNADSKKVFLSPGDWVEEDDYRAAETKVREIPGVESVDGDTECVPDNYRDSDQGGWVFLKKSAVVIIRKAYRIPNNPIKYRKPVDVDYTSTDPAYWAGLHGKISDRDWAHGVAGAFGEHGSPEVAAEPKQEAVEYGSATGSNPWRISTSEAKGLLGHLKAKNKTIEAHKPGAWWVLPDGSIIGHQHDLDRSRSYVVRHDSIAGRAYDDAGIPIKGGAWPNRRDEGGIHGSSELAQLMHDTGAVRVNTTKDMAREGVAVSMHGAPTDAQRNAIAKISNTAPGQMFVWEVKDPDKHADDDAIHGGYSRDALEKLLPSVTPNRRARELSQGPVPQEKDLDLKKGLIRKANDILLRQDIRQASTDTNSMPSLAQVNAENFKKGSFRWNGLVVKIENPKGSMRCDKQTGGKRWKVKMGAHYGHFFRSSGSDKTPIGYDGDPVDVFVGSHPESEIVFIVDQVLGGKFDEHKVIIGCRSEKEAKQTYLGCYGPSWNGIGEISSMILKDFKEWLKNGSKDKPISWSGS